ncbi:MAG: T9SS type A sorting domain-containing protein [Flavobacteriaceae bacterium]|nr:T9SS type A sorting domain-containing protein [Flavobacteriaceae bacterium]
MKKIFTFLGIIVSVMNFAQAINVTASSGTPSANYTTLKASFDAINAGTHQGVIQINVSGNTTETAAAVLNNSTTYTSVTIKPTAGTTATISGNLAGAALVKINGSNVTIDGSNTADGTTRNLTFNNTGTSSSQVLHVASAAGVRNTNITLKNAVFINGTQLSSAIILTNSTNTAPGDFKDVTIDNVSVQKAFMGIFARANADPNNTNFTVKNSNLDASGTNALSGTGIYTEGIDGVLLENNNVGNIPSGIVTNQKTGFWIGPGTKNAVVKNNEIHNITHNSNFVMGMLVAPSIIDSNITISDNTIADLTQINNVSIAGIWLLDNGTNPTTGVSITNNQIMFIKQNGPYGAVGIMLNASNTTGTNNIFNNFIFDIAADGWDGTAFSDNGWGIYVNSGTGYKIYNNTIYMRLDQFAPEGITAAMMIGSGVTAVGALDLRNNIFVNSQTIGNRYAIYSVNSNNNIFSNIDYNDYYSTQNLGFIGSARANLAALQAGFGGNTNSKNILPVFTSFSNLHLNLADNPTLDNLGTLIPGGATTDIDGETRSTIIPDMGADEFGLILMGTAEVSKNKIAVYPNPVKNILYISPLSPKGGTTLTPPPSEGVGGRRIYDISGKLVKMFNGNSVDVSGFQKGIYILNVDNQSIKFIKE